MNIIHKARILLIRIGKALPFAYCVLIIVSYIENVYALLSNHFVNYDGTIILRKPISFLIGTYCEYNIQTLLILSVISIAVETCKWNKIACIYLGLNLVEKSLFDFEMYAWQIYTLCVVNVLVASYITYKGVKVYLT